MHQRTQRLLGDPYEKLSELESKLDRANRYIRRLRLEKAELQRQIAALQQQTKKPQPKSWIESFPFLRLPLGETPRRRRRRSAKYAEVEGATKFKGLRRQRRLAPVYRLRLAAVALTGVAIVFIVGLTIVRLINWGLAQPSEQRTAVVQQGLALPMTPLLPPEFPVITKEISPPKLSEQSAENVEFLYNVNTAPDLKPSQDLQAIVDEMVKTAQQRRLPIESLSITLINVKTGEIAGYQQQQLKYSASVIKMFWMVCVYELLQRGIFPDEAAFSADLYKMIQQSSNDAASRLIDTITNTESGENLQGDKYQTWADRRSKLSEFFQKAGYQDIGLHQKTYPINYLKHKQPEGRDLQMWKDPKGLKNLISSDHAARLMYEIVTGKSVSPEASDKMIHLLARDLRPESWKENTAKFGGFHPIKGFLGQSLPSDVDFASKAGWTETGRHEVAFVRSRDDGPVYILAVLGGDEAYSKDWQAFPTMSRLVFDRQSAKALEK